MKLTLILLAALLGTALAWPNDRPKDRNKLPRNMVCYWGTWAFYRDSYGKFQAEDVNPNLCTHLIYGFAKLVGNRIEMYDPDLDYGSEDWGSGLPWGRGMIRRMNRLRNYNSNIATLMAIGGWNEGSDKYSLMASTAAGRQEFVASVMQFLDTHELDGLDLDWEYPTMTATSDEDRQPTGPLADKQNFVELSRLLREAFEPKGYILSAAVSAGKPTVDRAYDILQISEQLDMINLMTYDFHGGWDNVTGHNAPLNPMPGLPEDIDKWFTTEYAVDYWLAAGVPASKLNMGMPMYGRTFTLQSSAQTGVGAPTVGTGGKAGPVTKVEGMMGYHEICNSLNHGLDGWTEHWFEPQQVSYATYAGTPASGITNQWVGFDNVQSIQRKVDFLLSRRLAGGMIWSIDTDDFTGVCGQGKYPLLKTISRGVINLDGPDTIIPVTPVNSKDHKAPWAPLAKSHPYYGMPNTHTNPKSSPKSYSTAFHCANTGYFKDPVHANKFYQCASGLEGKLVAHSMSCAPGTTFSEKLLICSH